MPELIIRPARASDIPEIVRWARSEEFSPGFGDVDIYRNTDKQGVWVGWVDSTPVGCIAGIKYNNIYGFIGLYIVRPEYRGQGYGHRLWEQALRHLQDVKCVGLEAASHLITNYAEWGFKTSSQTIRWQLFNSEDGLSSQAALNPQDLKVVSGPDIPLEAIKKYDSEREFTARPHFLSQWLKHPSGKVIALIDKYNHCHGFARIRPCLLPAGEGWRIGPILADSPVLAKALILNLLIEHKGVILIDSPQRNDNSQSLLSSLGFREISATTRMYKGSHKVVLTKDVYGLACLELG
jgi:[ribosomal protein S18]-alanine N-acetyltransferase